MRQLAMILACKASALLALSLPAAADSGCARFKWPVAREEAAFAAGTLPVVSPGGQLPGVMTAATLSLAAQDGMSFAAPPLHKPRSKPAYAGAFLLPPTTPAGSFQVTLSEDAWIDVVQNGKLLKQTGFTGVKDCPAVRKSVKFDLAAGPATIMISDAGTDTLKIDILPPAP